MFSWVPPEKNTPKRNRISRSEHISSYVNHPTLKPSTRQMNRDDDSTYDTVFQTRSSNTLILRVHLSTQNTAPRMILVGAKLTHPWIDSSYRIIGFPSIASEAAWESSGLKLGDAVSSVVLHLQLNPPTVIDITDVSLKKMQPANAVIVASHPEPSPPSYESVVEPDPDFDFDFDIPTSFPTLEALSKDDVSHLLTNSSAFDEFASLLPSKDAILEFKSDLTADNVNTANEIIQHQVELEELANDVDSLSISYQDKINKYQALKSEQLKLSMPMDVRDVRKKLLKAKKEAFEESEDLALSWVDDPEDVPIHEFIDQFMKKRHIFHERAAKIEMLSFQTG